MRVVFTIICLFLSCTVNSAFLSNQEPLKIYGASTIRFGVDNPSVDLCSYFQRHFTFDATTEGGKNMLSILLSAKMANRKVSLWYTSSTAPNTIETNGCTISAMAILTSIGID